MGTFAPPTYNADSVAQRMSRVSSWTVPRAGPPGMAPERRPAAAVLARGGGAAKGSVRYSGRYSSNLRQVGREAPLRASSRLADHCGSRFASDHHRAEPQLNRCHDGARTTASASPRVLQDLKRKLAADGPIGGSLIARRPNTG